MNLPELRRKLLTHAQAHAEFGDVWREMLGEDETVLAGRPVDLNSDEPEAVVRLDEPWKNDPLAIRADVEAFAALLVSRNLEPPLSIGLFGPWGSGKTTFSRGFDAPCSIVPTRPGKWVLLRASTYPTSCMSSSSPGTSPKMR